MTKQSDEFEASYLAMAEDSGLVETLYSRRPIMLSKRRKRKGFRNGRRKRPKHYKLVCISLYNHDIEKLEGHVQALKKKGHTKANKSQVIRFAIDKVPVVKMPKAY